MTQAAKYFKVHPETIRRYIKADKLLLNKYKIIQKSFAFFKANLFIISTYVLIFNIYYT